MKNGRGTFLTLGVAFLLCVLIAAVSCDSSQSPTAPSQTTLEKKNMNDLDGIRVNGTESDETHPPVRTYEVWYGGAKLQGPTPLKNYWTKADADWALVQAQNGIK